MEVVVTTVFRDLETFDIVVSTPYGKELERFERLTMDDKADNYAINVVNNAPSAYIQLNLPDHEIPPAPCNPKRGGFNLLEGI